MGAGGGWGRAERRWLPSCRAQPPTPAPPTHPHPSVAFYTSGYLALWSSIYGVWSGVFYARYRRFIYPFLGAGMLCVCVWLAGGDDSATWPEKQKPMNAAAVPPLCPDPRPTHPRPADVHKPYAWASYLGLFGVHWFAYCLIMALAAAKLRVVAWWKQRGSWPRAVAAEPAAALAKKAS